MTTTTPPPPDIARMGSSLPSGDRSDEVGDFCAFRAVRIVLLLPALVVIGLVRLAWLRIAPARPPIAAESASAPEVQARLAAAAKARRESQEAAQRRIREAREAQGPVREAREAQGPVREGGDGAQSLWGRMFGGVR